MFPLPPSLQIDRKALSSLLYARHVQYQRLLDLVMLFIFNQMVVSFSVNLICCLWFQHQYSCCMKADRAPLTYLLVLCVQQTLRNFRISTICHNEYRWGEHFDHLGTDYQIPGCLKRKLIDWPILKHLKSMEPNHVGIIRQYQLLTFLKVSEY